MTSRPEPENSRASMPFGNLEQLTFELQALSESGLYAGDGIFPGRNEDEPALFQLDRQEQLAIEVVWQVQELKLKLETYLAFQSAYARDDTLRQDTESAVAWVGTTIDDLVATIVGVEAARTKTAGQAE